MSPCDCEHSATWMLGWIVFGKTISYIDGLVQDCSISIANALEILQFCTKATICTCLVTTTLCYICGNLSLLIPQVGPCGEKLIPLAMWPCAWKLLAHCLNNKIPETSGQQWTQIFTRTYSLKKHHLWLWEIKYIIVLIWTHCTCILEHAL